MRLAHLTLTGFRCFGNPTTIAFDDVTALVGANGVGKTAILAALVRMFGTTNAQRTLTKDDFHLQVSDEAPTALELTLDAIFEFPELLDDDEAADSTAIPECLRHIMLVDDVETPQCRVMLRATWQRSAAPDGDIDQKLLWVSSAEPTPPEDALHALAAVERSFIQVFYVPATRDAVRELRAVSGTILSRVLQHVAWSDSVKDLVREATDTLTEIVRGEDAVQELETLLKTHWISLCDRSGAPQFIFAESDLVNLLRGMGTRLQRADGSKESLTLLSEGERSLMYFALVQSALEFERARVSSGPTPTTGASPILTIVGVEEPENHLAPHYLGRILASLRGVIATGAAQVLLTSHSVALMRRIEPTEIRHLRVEAPGTHHISQLALPPKTDEAFKYVREAVRSHPELYFARVVVLCEGASEEVVLPRVARAHGVDVDPRFVTVVPLGGRHVNHFWRLLRELRIPFVTLLDLDTERLGGGWGRVHYLVSQLIELGESRKRLLGGLSDEEFEEFAKDTEKTEVGDANLQSWINDLEKDFGIFLSAPLDIDLLLFEAFESRYKKLAPAGGGPRIPREEPSRKRRFAEAARVVLGDGGGDGNSYPTETRERFPWCSYLFLAGSKPTAHAAVFAELRDKELAKSCPDVLTRLVARVSRLAKE